MYSIRTFVTGPTLGVITMLIALGLYLATIAPTLSWGWRGIGVDGGELLAAAHSLGVPHPSGYPTYMLLLKGFGTLIPIGDFAFRGNLLSAVLGASSAGLLYWFVYRISFRLDFDVPPVIRGLGASFAALAYACAPIIWSQTVITEVYTLNALFVGALCVEAAYLTERRKADRLLLLGAGLTLGLGLGNHLTLLAVALPLAAWVAVRRYRRTPYAWVFMVGLVLGLSVYAYLPIRGAADPVVNWGDADSWSGLYWLISGQVYQDYVFGIPVESLGNKLLQWLSLVFEQLNPLGLFLAILGAAALYRSDRVLLGTSGISVLVLLAYSIAYNTFDSQVLTIPAFFIISAYAGLGLCQVVTAASEWVEGWSDGLNPKAGFRRLPIIALLLIAFVAVPVIGVYLNYDAQDRSDDLRASEYAEKVLESAPVGAVVLSDAEARVFSLWYYSFVEQSEPGIIPVSSRLLAFDWYWDDLVKRHPSVFPATAPDDVGDALMAIVTAAGDDPGVYFTYSHAFLSDKFELTTPVPQLHRAMPKR